MNKNFSSLLLMFLVFVTVDTKGVWAQAADKQWIFGDDAGLDFNAEIPIPFAVPATDEYGFNAYEGCASISNEDGALLFYTNGQSVWNREFSIMPNGNGIVPPGSMVGSTTQATAIVQVPGNNTRYYVFSLEEQAITGRLYYTVVDMSLNGGLGDVVATEKALLLDEGLTEKMTVAPGKCRQAWIVVRSKTTNEYRSYAVTEAGLNTEPVISVVGGGPLNSYITGTVKCSKDGKRIAAALFPRPPENIAGIELYDFNGATGILSDAVMLAEKIPGLYEAGYYGLCFSPDDTKLYASNHFPNTIHQFDISLPTIDAIRASETLVEDMGPEIPGDMRTGPDGKLYIAVFSSDHLNRIDFPNVAGSDCGFVTNAVMLPFATRCMLGLPNSNIIATSATVYDTITSYTHVIACAETGLSCPQAEGPYSWSNGETTKEITITEPGIYYVVSHTSCARMVDSFEVTFVNLPSSLLGKDTQVCIGNSIALSVLSSVSGHFSLSWSTGSEDRSIQVTTPGTYFVTASLPPCIVADTLMVTHKDCDCYLEVPSAFSPNGDGINDEFLPVGTPGCAAIEAYSLNIYNRWGQRIFSSNVMSKGWDGKQAGILVDLGVYFYTLSYIDRNNQQQGKKGDIAVIR